MRCKDMKKHIRNLERKNRELQNRNDALRSMEERCYPFNLLEIVVRPSRQELIRYELIGLDLSVQGNDQMPTVCNYKTMRLSAFDLLRENEDEFIKTIGETMARELLAYKKKQDASVVAPSPQNRP